MPSIAEVLKKMEEQATLTKSQEDIAPISFKCENCKDKGGWIELRDADVFGNGNYIRKEQVWVECSCVKQRKIERLIHSSHITDEFQKLGFGNFHAEGLDPRIAKMKEVASRYYSEFREAQQTMQNSIALIGQPGIGKTHLLMAVSNNLIQKRSVPVMYFPYVSTIAEMQANDFEKDEAITQRAKEVEVLFIDDLYKPAGGKAQATIWQQRKMYDIVNHRYLNKMPILLSSELEFPEMLAVDEATASRLFEMTEEYTVSVEKDFRLNYRTRRLFNKEAK